MAWSATLATAYNSETSAVFALNGTLRKRLEGTASYEWGIEAPDTIPTVAAGSLTGLTGDYNAKYTYLRKERNTIACESNASEEGEAAVALTDGSLLITAADPEDEQVNGVRYYRTTTDGTVYYLSGERNFCNLNYSVCYDWENTEQYITGIAWRFTTEDENNERECCYIWELVYDKYRMRDYQNRITGKADNDLAHDDNKADSALGTLLHTDHNRPPKGSFVFGPSANGTLFVLKNHQAYYSKPQQPEYFPSSYYVDVSAIQYSLVCGVFYDTRPYLFDSREIYYLAGTQFADLPNLTTFRPYPQGARWGAVNAASVAPVLGLGIFHVGNDGIYRFMPGEITGTDEKITDIIEPLFRSETVNGIPYVSDFSTCWLEFYQDKLYFGYTGTGDSYPQSVLVFDFVRKRVIYHEYPFDLAVSCNDKYNARLLAVGSAGNIIKLEDRTVTEDNSTAIDWEIETKQFVLQTRLHYPRWNKYDIDASDDEAENVYAYSYLEDTLIQTHAITGARNPKRRLIDLQNGNRFSVRVTGTGPIDIYAIESE